MCRADDAGLDLPEALQARVAETGPLIEDHLNTYTEVLPHVLVGDVTLSWFRLMTAAKGTLRGGASCSCSGHSSKGTTT